jgi:heme/copper-type cytochrome/quinol oxidase subunit 3
VAVSTRSDEAAAVAEARLDASLVAVGIRLFLAADTTFFAAWWFAFFYLRALNNNQSWRASGVSPPSVGYGAVVLAFAVLSAITYLVGSRQATRDLLFRLLTPVSLVLALAVILFQTYELWHLGFDLTQGGYPSVFSGLSGAWVIEFAFATVWLATIVVQARPDGDTLARRQPAASFAWILLFLAAIGAVNYILLYFVA